MSKESDLRYKKSEKGREVKRRSERKRRQVHKEKFNTYYLNRRDERKYKAIEILGGKCLDCGNIFPKEVYDFHHLDAKSAKSDMISRLIQSRKWTVVEEELKKCILLCANCHRIRHINERS